MDEMTNTFKIWEINLSKFGKEIERLNKRAAKLGQAPITLEILGEEFVEITWKRHRLHGQTLKLFEIKVEGVSPKLEGWTFVAAIDHEPEGNIIRSIPSDEYTIPEHYRTAKMNCDHCQTNRKRTSTFLLISDEGEWVQLGRQCIKDFTGHKSPESIALFAEHLAGWIDEWRSEEWPIGDDWDRVSNYTSLVGWLSMTAAVIEEYGWRSNTKAREMGLASTSDRVYNHVFPSNDMIRDGDVLEYASEHRELAEAVIDWIDGELSQKENLSDYEWNLVKLVGDGRETYFKLNYAGYVSSMVMAYKRAKGLLEAAKHEADPNWKPSEHQGEIKERRDWVLTCKSKREFSSYNPRTGYDDTKYVYNLEDDDYNIFVWFTTLNVIDEGDVMKIKGTIKKHDAYNGVKQTILTRCKVLETLEEGNG